MLDGIVEIKIIAVNCAGLLERWVSHGAVQPRKWQRSPVCNSAEEMSQWLSSSNERLIGDNDTSLRVDG